MKAVYVKNSRSGLYITMSQLIPYSLFPPVLMPLSIEIWSADLLVHPLIYVLSISLKNSRLMGRMVKPAGFKECRVQKLQLLNSQTNEAADCWQETVCSTEKALSARWVTSNPILASFMTLTISGICCSVYLRQHVIIAHKKTPWS